MDANTGNRGRARARGVRVRGGGWGGQGQGRSRTIISDEIRPCGQPWSNNEGGWAKSTAKFEQAHCSIRRPDFPNKGIIIGKKSTLTRKLQYFISIWYSFSTVVQFCLWTVL